MKTGHRFKTDDGAEQIFFLHNASSAPTVKRYAIWVRDKDSDGVTRGYHSSQNIHLFVTPENRNWKNHSQIKLSREKFKVFQFKKKLYFQRNQVLFTTFFNLNSWSEISLVQHWWRNPKTETVYQEYLRRQAELGTAGCHSRKPSCSFKHNPLPHLLTKPTT